MPLSTEAADRAGARLRWIRTDSILFVVFLALYEATAYILSVHFDFYVGDAASRTAQAAMVIVGRDPHLAAIGLVWTPLPSLAELPLIWLFDRLGWPLQLAGPMTVAFFGAVNVPLIFRIGLEAGARKSLAIFAAIAYGLHPMVWLYASNGMSEACFATWLALIILFWLRWVHRSDVVNLAGASLALAGAWWTRYEAIPIAAGLGVALMLMIWYRKGSSEELQAVLLNSMTPFVYSIFLWLFFNWVLVGNPLFFLNGPYSNAALTIGLRSSTGPMAGVYRSIPGSLAFLTLRITYIFVGIWPALLLCLVVIVRRRDIGLLSLLVLLGSLEAFYLEQLFVGQLFPWYRYWIMIPLFGITLILYLDGAGLRGTGPAATTTTAKAARFHWPVFAAPLLIVGSLAVACFSMTKPTIAVNEYPSLMAITGHPQPSSLVGTFAEDRAVAHYVSSLPPGLILMDSSTGERIFLLAKDRSRFVVASNRDFEQILGDPRRYVSYVLVAKPGTVPYDTVLAKYPKLYDQGASWATLIKTFPGRAAWKVYKVKRPGTTAQ